MREGGGVVKNKILANEPAAFATGGGKISDSRERLAAACGKDYADSRSQQCAFCVKVDCR
jgi:hypothetical protein